MAAIGVRNVRLQALQRTARDTKSLGKGVIRLTRLCYTPAPPELRSVVKVSISILFPMQNVPTCTALSHPTAHCGPHRRPFQVIFGNRDGARGELGGPALQGVFLMACKTLNAHVPYRSPHIIS